MELTAEEQEMLAGKQGKAVQKAMQILETLGRIYGAQRMVAVSSVQISGVSFDNLGEAGLEFLAAMAEAGGKARVLTTLNPAGMDTENWQRLGITPEFAANQQRVIQAYAQMGVVTTCTCTPYLSGNLPLFGEHIAWAESSAVCYANAVIGARTNREGGPSALAAALTGRTPEYGYHLDTKRRADITVQVQARLPEKESTHLLGALGKTIGEKISAAGFTAPYILGLQRPTLEGMKAFCASIATYGGVASFHIGGITPEAAVFSAPSEAMPITQSELDSALASLSNASEEEVDFVSLGCPHLSLREIARLAELLRGKKVVKEFWITTARPVRQIADRMGYTEAIEGSGAKLVTDTCCVVSPIKERFKAIATDSAKACYYAYTKNKFKTVLKPFDEVVALALGNA